MVSSHGDSSARGGLRDRDRVRASVSATSDGRRGARTDENSSSGGGSAPGSGEVRPIGSDGRNGGVLLKQRNRLLADRNRAGSGGSNGTSGANADVNGSSNEASGAGDQPGGSGRSEGQSAGDVGVSAPSPHGNGVRSSLCGREGTSPMVSGVTRSGGSSGMRDGFRGLDGRIGHTHTVGSSHDSTVGVADSGDSDPSGGHDLLDDMLDEMMSDSEDAPSVNSQGSGSSDDARPREGWRARPQRTSGNRSGSSVGDGSSTSGGSGAVRAEGNGLQSGMSAPEGKPVGAGGVREYGGSGRADSASSDKSGGSIGGSSAAVSSGGAHGGVVESGSGGAVKGAHGDGGVVPVGVGVGSLYDLEDRKYVVQWQRPKRNSSGGGGEDGGGSSVGVTDPYVLNPENKPFVKGYRPPPRKPGQGLQPLPSDTGEYVSRGFAPDVRFPVRSKGQEAELRRRQRSGETVSGRKKRNPKKKYHRLKITQKDLVVLELIAVSGAATSRSVQTILGLKAPKSAPKRLLGLKEMGLIIQHTILSGGKCIYTLRPKGAEVLRENRSGVDFDNVKTRSVKKGPRMSERGAHNAMVSYTVAKECRDHGFMPAFFCNERWMERHCSGGVTSRDERLRLYREQMLDAYYDLSNGVREGIMEKYPMLWVPCAKDDEKDKYSSFHQPDLIMRYDVRDRNGRAKSVAYEIELTRKARRALKKVLRNYAWSGWFAYGEVRYLVASDGLGRYIRKCADAVADEFEERAKHERNPRDRGFFRSGAAFLREAVKIERITDMNGVPLEMSQISM